MADQLHTAARCPRSALRAVALTGLVLLACLLLAAGEAAADPPVGGAEAQPTVDPGRGLLFPNRPGWLTPVLPGSEGLAPAAQETSSYAAWMTDRAGAPGLVQYADPSESNLWDPGCQPGYAQRRGELTGGLDTKQERALEIQKATHESIGDFDLPAGLPQVEREAIVLSVAAQESGGHGFNNEMVTAGWSRGIMQITTNAYVGAGNGGCAEDDVDCKHCRARVDVEACYRYYSNTADGISRNVRDGLYALQDKHSLFGYPEVWEPVDLGFGDPVTGAEMTWMFTLKRYGPSYRATRPFHYVRLIGSLVQEGLAAHYEDHPVYPELGQKLSHAYGQVISSSGPADLRARDIQGRRTGRVGDGVEQGLPNAWYNSSAHLITALFPADPLYYQIAGRKDGTYELDVLAESPTEAGSWPEGSPTVAWFTLADVPIAAGAVHEYVVDWESGAKTATRWIDADGDGQFGDPVTIHVPEASFTFDPPIPHSGRPVDFDGSGSSHPEDGIVSYHWNFGDGVQMDAGPLVVHSYERPGSYTVRLTVREGHGAIDTTSRVVTVIFEPTDFVYIPFVLSDSP